MAIEGITGAPYKTPQVRKKIPAPYQRPSIGVSGGFVKRSWKDIRVIDVAPGDNVAGFGIVVAKEEDVNLPGNALTVEHEVEAVWTVKLTNVMGDSRHFPGETRVFAFTADPS